MLDANRSEQLKTVAQNILLATQKAKIEARLLGGMAIYLSSPCAHSTPFLREIQDLDFVVDKKNGYTFSKLMEKIGFKGDHEFNSIHGESRLLFTSKLTDIDVFVGAFQQCHTIALDKYFKNTKTYIPLFCLLLTKLQVVEINRKDILDILALLHDHELGNGGDPEQQIQIDQFLEIIGNDWGWYTTVTDNIEKIQKLLPSFNFYQQTENVLENKLKLLLTEAQNCRKSIKWKLRAKLGRKIPWYDLPEEKVL